MLATKFIDIYPNRKEIKDTMQKILGEYFLYDTEIGPEGSNLVSFKLNGKIHFQKDKKIEELVKTIQNIYPAYEVEKTKVGGIGTFITVNIQTIDYLEDIP
jgi:hypothetical protein